MPSIRQMANLLLRNGPWEILANLATGRRGKCSAEAQTLVTEARLVRAKERLLHQTVPDILLRVPHPGNGSNVHSTNILRIGITFARANACLAYQMSPTISSGDIY
jgi:hypothetical protein